MPSCAERVKSFAISFRYVDVNAVNMKVDTDLISHLSSSRLCSSHLRCFYPGFQTPSLKIFSLEEDGTVKSAECKYSLDDSVRRLYLTRSRFMDTKFEIPGFLVKSSCSPASKALLFNRLNLRSQQPNCPSINS